MAELNIVTVNIEMPNGTIHGPIQLYPLTVEDSEEMEYVLDQAQIHGHYNIGTQTIQFDAIGGSNLYWEGLGARDRFDFEAISLGIVVQGILYWSNPLIDAEETDDLESQCLCQDGFSCLICRLQKRAQQAEASKDEAEQEQDAESTEFEEIVEERDDLFEEIERLQAENDLFEDKMDNLKGFVAEISKENSTLEERNAELQEENSELREQIRQLRNKIQKPIKYAKESISGATGISRNNGSAQAARSQLDYDSNVKFHKHARQGVIERRAVSNEKASDPENLKDTHGRDREVDGFQPKSLHDKHTTFFPARRERGGKYRSDEDSNFDRETIKMKRAIEVDGVAKDLEPPKKRHKYAMLSNGRFEKREIKKASGFPIQKDVTVIVAESEDSHPALKRHNSVTRLSGNTGKLTEKGIGMNRSCGIDRGPCGMLPKSIGSLVNRLPGKIEKSKDPSQKINGRSFSIERRMEKKRRYKNDDDDDDDDEDEDFNPDIKRQRCSKTHSSSLERGTVFTKSVGRVESAGRATNNSRSSFLDEPQHETLKDVQTTTSTARAGRSTNNSLSHFLDGHSGATIPHLSQRNVSNASIGSEPPATSLPPQAPQPSLASTDGRRSTGWTDRERQAFIVLMNIQVNHTAEEDRLHDVHLYEFMSTQLRQRHGIHRNPGACKNEWNRRLRVLTGIDERKVKNPRKLATSVQAGS